MFIEMWLVYALLAAILVGIFSFTTKIVAEKNYDKDLSLFYLYLCSFILSIIYFIFFGELKYSLGTFVAALVTGILYPINLKTRFVSLKYISSSTYFINYRIFSSSLLLVLGIYLFSESVTYFQVVGIVIGFFIFYLLLEKKEKKEKIVDFKKGI
ncbi:MAG: hypothetical protein HRU03_07350, partial [Nanoarchaeales archaeon]|nr:hypothetical protein [Nanoarchaeales archaeon]